MAPSTAEDHGKPNGPASSVEIRLAVLEAQANAHYTLCAERQSSILDRIKELKDQTAEHIKELKDQAGALAISLATIGWAGWAVLGGVVMLVAKAFWPILK